MYMYLQTSVCRGRDSYSGGHRAEDARRQAGESGEHALPPQRHRGAQRAGVRGTLLLLHQNEVRGEREDGE